MNCLQYYLQTQCGRWNALVVILLLVFAAESRAADMFWSQFRDDGSGTFSVADNWAGGDVPGLFDNAHFGMSSGDDRLPATYTVTFTNHPDNRRLIVEDDHVTFDLNGHTYRTTYTLETIQLGTVAGRSGRLTIIDGTVVAPFESNIAIGWGGAGSLTVSTDGLVIGAPDVLLNSISTLTVVNGGDIIANEVFANGTATITGNGSALVATGLDVGFSGDGSLNVNAGGQLETTSGVAGINVADSGTINVDGPGSRWTNSGPLTLAFQGFGRLNITGGGTVSNGNAVIASRTFGTNAIPSVGSVTVAGAGSLWNVNGRLALGGNPSSGLHGGSAALIIRSGGTVNVTQDTLIYSNDLLWLDGGTLSTTEISFPVSELSLDPGDFDWTSGTLHVGIYRGDLTVPNGGVLAPGNSVGSTVVFGDYNQETSGAKLQIEIGGSPPSFQFDKLEVRGDAVLGGNLELSLLGGFVPTAANGYAVLTPTVSLSGQFDNVASGQRLKTSDGGGSFVINYGAGSPFNPTFVVLSEFQITGDLNGNGFVGQDDLGIVLANWGQNVTPGDWMLGDPSFDGFVGQNDLNDVLGNWGQSAPSALAAVTTVPEPRPLLLVAIAVAGFFPFCRRAWHR